MLAVVMLACLLLGLATLCEAEGETAPCPPPAEDVVVGRIVHFVMTDGDERPAMIVRVWNDTCVNLQVFPDGLNDRRRAENDFGWRTSCLYQAPDPTGKDCLRPMSWHWCRERHPGDNRH